MIAAVNGMACGGAFYMLGEVEFVIAAEHATFFDPHVTYGMTAAFEPMHMLQKMPFHEIMRLSLLGNHERLSAKRAYEIGLVSEVVPADELQRPGACGRPTPSPRHRRWPSRAPCAPFGRRTRSRSQAALAQVSTLVALGTTFENIESGQAEFQNARPEWRLR